MDTLRVDICYRPLRIGWLIDSEDLSSFRTAVRNSYALWGGRFNPILFTDRPDETLRLINRFRVDRLWPLGNVAAARDILAAHDHLDLPYDDLRLFETRPSGAKCARLLDLENLLIHLANGPHLQPLKESKVRIHTWVPQDPLSDALLLQLGDVPGPQEAPDYRALLREVASADDFRVFPDAAIPASVLASPSIATLNRHSLSRHHSLDVGMDMPGFYLGDASDIEDLVACWNLRAADIPLLFVDKRHLARYAAIIPEWARLMREQFAGRLEGASPLTVWTRDRTLSARDSFPGLELSTALATDGTWNGLNVRVPLMSLGESSSLGIVERTHTQPQVTFNLSDKPFDTQPWFTSQQLVASVGFGIGLFGDELHTLHLPWVPELNRSCSEAMHFGFQRIRLEPGRIGVLVNVSDVDAYVRAMPVGALTKEILLMAGIESSPSTSGRILRQFITRLDGLLGAAILRDPGVRQLIRTHGHNASFTRKAAIDLMCSPDPDHPRPRLKDKARGAGALNAFSALVARGLYRVGADLLCPKCEIRSWVPLDTLAERVTCETCGARYSAAQQLVAEEWAYRRSGVLGIEKHAQGAVPVALTLNYLYRSSFSYDGQHIYGTSLDLEWSDGMARKSEVDFVWMEQRPNRQRDAIVVAECKDRYPMTTDAILGLRDVAARLPRDRFKTFVLLSKLAPFTTDEIAAARGLNSLNQLNAILLTNNELEANPEHVNRAGRSRRRGLPEALAWMTFEKYFKPLGDRAEVGMPA